MFAGMAVIAAALLPTAPAAADEPPTPDPTPSIVPTQSAPPSDPAPSDPPASDPAPTPPATSVDPFVTAPATYPSDGPGEVVIDNSSGTVTAVDSNFPGTHTPFTYQWYRGSTAISGDAARHQTYTLTSADRNKLLKVKISTTIPGYTNTVVRYSPARNLTITTVNPASSLVITGTGQPGVFLAATNSLGYRAEGATVTPLLQWTWLRDGVPVVYPNDPSFLLYGSDYGKTISVRVTASKPGWISNVTTSAGLKVNVPGILVSEHQPDITSSGTTLTVNAALTDVVDHTQSSWTSSKITYQWFRDNAKITGATKASYTLSQSKDWGTSISVQLKYSALGYGTFSQYGKSGGNGFGRYYISTSVDAIELGGEVRVGGTLSSNDPATYYDQFDGGTEITSGIHEAYQWYRSGVAIPSAEGGQGATYLLKSADKGKKITLKITTTATGKEYDLASIAKTPFATAAVGTDLLPGASTPAPSLVIAQTVPKILLAFDAGLGEGVTGLTSPGGAANTVKYQWFRNSSAITGATKPTYTLTQADWGHDVSLRIVTSHGAVGTHTYTTDTRYTDVKDRSVYPSSPGSFVTVGGAPYATGSPVTAALPSWESSTSALSGVSVTQQWYRNGVAIPASEGGTAATYTLRSADVGKTVSEKITAAANGFIPYVTTYSYLTPSLKVAKGTLAGTADPTVSIDAPTNVLTASAPTPTGFGGSPNASVAYRWMRNGAAISGATHATYKLTASDWGKNVKVQVTSTLPGYTTDVRSSPDHDYSIRPHVTDPISIAGTFRLGETLTATSINFSDSYGHLLTPDDVSFQWLRNGVAISGATDTTYALDAPDYDKTISLKYTATKAGYITLVKTVTSTGSNAHIGKGVTADTWTASVVAGGLGILTANVTGLSPATPTPSYSYKWYRNGSVISGASSKNYTLVAADYDATIKVQITIARTHWVSSTKQSTEAKHSIYMDPMGPQIVGPVKVGHTLSTESVPVFYANSAKTIPLDAPPMVLVHAWYRDGSVIPGATGATYLLVAADEGKMITSKVTAKAPGLLALKSLVSNELGPVVP
jgi:hypothetical protein